VARGILCRSKPSKQPHCCVDGGISNLFIFGSTIPGKEILETNNGRSHVDLLDKLVFYFNTFIFFPLEINAIIQKVIVWMQLIIMKIIIILLLCPQCTSMNIVSNSSYSNVPELQNKSTPCSSNEFSIITLIPMSTILRNELSEEEMYFLYIYQSSCI
jgi:hypothetical protein